MLTIVTWLWGDKLYSGEDVRKLFDGVRRHLKQDHQLVCICDREMGVVGAKVVPIPLEDRGLLNIRGCFARLRLFDPMFQLEIGARERIVCLDLDAVVTGGLDELFDRPDLFCILQGANASNPCPFNGSLWMLQAGYRADVWRDFSLEKAKTIPHYEFPDDQGWLWAKLPAAEGWKCGDKVWSFAKNTWPKDNRLPKDARLVVFPGWRSPKQFTDLNWIREHWR